MKFRAFLLALAVPAIVVGQEIVPPPVIADLQTYVYDSGVHANAGTAPAVVHTHEIVWPGASSLRILFSNVTIGASDALRVTSPLTGEEHRLDPVELAKWEFTSGYFNGDRLRLELVLAPESSGSFRIGSLLVGFPPPGADTICGVDDRIASTDYKSMRFSTLSGGQAASAGCTIWLAGGGDCALSAGHCFSGGTLAVAETMCPISLASGSVQHPPIQFQFTVQTATITFVNGGQGNDFGVCMLNPNNVGQSPSALFGSFQLAFALPAVGEAIRITGYGTDSGVENQTLQTHVGPYASTSGTSLRYATDTTGGNSGSPVIQESTGLAVGIHTHGGCTSTGGANSGTSTTLAAFIAAYQALCPPPLPSFNIAATTTGGGVNDFLLQVNNLPSNAVQGFTLLSLDTALPAGQGSLLGLRADTLTLACLTAPAFAGNLLHWTLPASGLFPTVPFALPAGAVPFAPGTKIDVRVAAFEAGGANLTATNLVRVTF